MNEKFHIGHLEVETPWGNAGGVIKHVEDVEVMARTGVGWIEAGSYTLEPRVGNSPNGEVVYHHDPITGETHNSLGMPNKGMDVVETEIPEMVRIAEAHNKSLIVNVAPVSEDPYRESRELVVRAYEAGAHAVLLNAGCPNVVKEDGSGHEILSHNTNELGVVLYGLRDLIEIYNRQVFVRISPMESEAKTQDVILAVRAGGATSAVFTPNTWPNRPLDQDGSPIIEVNKGVAGKSGPAVAEDAYEQTLWTVKALERSGIDVVSSSGITNAEELHKRLAIGAAACAGTTFYYESGDWREDTDKLIRDFTMLA